MGCVDVGCVVVGCVYGVDVILDVTWAPPSLIIRHLIIRHCVMLCFLFDDVCQCDDCRVSE